ncbi:MAG: NADH-quinone oxidoreductase subunit J [Gammaproteobacteria bacterium]|nr:NADH-quinone oxidoreductase subunit J [Gammaproteobacteria bacterium]
MGIEKIIFYFAALVMIASATMVITVRNPIRAALFLVLTFFSSAIIWMILEAEFLAITLVLVYVGAVMVLFLFVVMMLDINIARLREGFIKFLPFGIAVAVVMAGLIIAVVGSGSFGLNNWTEPARHAADYNNTRELGLVLYTKYVYPFEIAAVILLVAIVAAIALTLRRRPTTKYQKPEEQIAVKRSDRVRVVSMDTEQKK